MTEDEYSQYSVAIHEAGHAFLSRRLGGFIVHYACIVYSNEANRWEGTYEHRPNRVALRKTPDEIYLTKIAKVAMAGIMSQTKWQLEHSLGVNLEYSLNSSFQDWLYFFTTDAKDLPDGYSPPVLMNDKMNQKEIEGRFNRMDYSGADLSLFRKWSTQVEKTEFPEVVSDVIALINNHGNWMQINQIAKQLVSASVHEGKKCLPWDSIIQITDSYDPVK
jgi:hypothetical protein